MRYAPDVRGMRGLLLTVVVGCGGGQVAETVPETFQPPAEPPSPEEPGWWSRSVDVCPDDAVLAGDAPPAGDEIWCQRPNGSKHGRWTWWADNGAKISEGEYLDDAPDGEWVVWYENGNRKAQGRYQQGRETGRWYGWDEAGYLTTDVTMDAGQRHGPWTWYHPNGRKAGEGEFLRGKPHGIWNRWDAGGRLTKVEEYDNDRLLRATEYRDGRPIAKAD